jgi:hypothetical protein
MGLEAQTQAETGQQAETRDDLELELLRRSFSALPDEPVDQIVHQGHRLRLAAVRMGQDRPARFATVNAKNRPSRSASTAASQDPVRGGLIRGQTRPDQPGRHRVQLTVLRHAAHTAALFAA